LAFIGSERAGEKKKRHEKEGMNGKARKAGTERLE
jgi:hypothetical protein